MSKRDEQMRWAGQTRSGERNIRAGQTRWTPELGIILNWFSLLVRLFSYDMFSLSWSSLFVILLSQMVFPLSWYSLLEGEGKLGGGGLLQTILKTNKKILLTCIFGRLEAGGYFCSRHEHTSSDIRHKSAEMSTRAQTFTNFDAEHIHFTGWMNQSRRSRFVSHGVMIIRDAFSWCKDGFWI